MNAPEITVMPSLCVPVEHHELAKRIRQACQRYMEKLRPLLLTKELVLFPIVVSTSSHF